MFTPDEFRAVLGHFPTGVTVLTSYGRDEPLGMAVNSATSMSLDPPLTLVCPAKSSSTWPGIRDAGGFCVNVLASHHQEVTRRSPLRPVRR